MGIFLQSFAGDPLFFPALVMVETADPPPIPNMNFEVTCVDDDIFKKIGYL